MCSCSALVFALWFLLNMASCSDGAGEVVAPHLTLPAKRLLRFVITQLCAGSPLLLLCKLHKVVNELVLVRDGFINAWSDGKADNFGVIGSHADCSTHQRSHLFSGGYSHPCPLARIAAEQSSKVQLCFFQSSNTFAHFSRSA